MFPLFLGMFLLVFVFTGIGNGSTYKMIPAIFRTEAERASTPGTPEREAALLSGTKKASAAVGIIGAVGAIGGFLIPITFGSPWVTDPLAATKTAFMVFAGFYMVCASVTFLVYLRKPHPAKARDQLRRGRHLRLGTTVRRVSGPCYPLGTGLVRT